MELGGSVSSQYLTALLMAAPLATGESGVDIRITDELVSQPYVDMTVRLMERFGVKVSILNPTSTFFGGNLNVLRAILHVSLLSLRGLLGLCWLGRSALDYATKADWLLVCSSLSNAWFALLIDAG